jgi:DeoR/GlpR family transcriptional regulator of sugar metabolism
MGRWDALTGARPPGQELPLKPRLRQTRILDVVARDGEVTVESLAQVFDVSAETIRRDLSQLAGTGALQKVHGGARRLRLHAEGSFQERMADNASEKRVIAEKLLSVIEPGDTVFMDTGSTTLIAAEALSRLPRLTVITNSLRIAQVMGRGDKSSRVFLLGGLLQQDNAETLGQMTVDDLGRFQADHAICSPAALDMGVGAMDADFDEAQVARAMCAAARHVIVLAHGAKLSRKAAFRICPLVDINLLITDRDPPDTVRAALEAAGVEWR